MEWAIELASTNPSIGRTATVVVVVVQVMAEDSILVLEETAVEGFIVELTEQRVLEEAGPKFVKE